MLQGVAIAAHAVGAVEALVYMHPEAERAREVMTQDIEKRREGLGALQVSVAIGPGGAGSGWAVLTSLKAMVKPPIAITAPAPAIADNSLALFDCTLTTPFDLRSNGSLVARALRTKT